jgi:hypothetical protein
VGAADSVTAKPAVVLLPLSVAVVLATDRAGGGDCPEPRRTPLTA